MVSVSGFALRFEGIEDQYAGLEICLPALQHHLEVGVIAG